MTDRVRVLRVIARLNIGGPALHAVLLTERLDPARYDSIDLVVQAYEAGDTADFLDATLGVDVGTYLPDDLLVKVDIVSTAESALRMQIKTDPRYLPFLPRATSREVLGLTLPVARLEDVLQGKIWAALDPTRRPSKRQKDLADIARLIEVAPELHARVPAELLARLV